MTSLLGQFRRVGRDLVSSHGGNMSVRRGWTLVLEETAQVLWLLRVLTGES